MISGLLKKYENCEEIVRKLFDSKLRLGILDALKDGPLRLSDLRREINANAPNTSAKAKELEGMDIIDREGGEYALTPYGIAIKARIDDTLSFYSTYEKFKNFWKTHHMEDIPPQFMKRLGELHNSEIISCSKENPIKTHEALGEYLQTVKKELYVMSPVLHDSWVVLLAQMCKGGVKEELTFTDEFLLEQFAKAGKDAIDIFDKNAKFFLIDERSPSPPGFIYSDTFSCFSIESKAVPNNYMDMKLYTTDPVAMNWHKDLYNYFKDKATEVKLSDYL